jgi:hypothetical protein
MLRGPLHNRDADGKCQECDEVFLCSAGVAIYNSVVQPSHWVDLEDRDARCPRCLHWWVSHGVPDEPGYGCTMIESSMAERQAMADRDRELQRQGVPPVAADPQTYRDLRHCDCSFAEGNTVTPRQVRIWSVGTSWLRAAWERADCGHHRRGPIREDNSQQCLDCGVMFVSDS